MPPHTNPDFPRPLGLMTQREIPIGSHGATPSQPPPASGIMTAVSQDQSDQDFQYGAFHHHSANHHHYDTSISSWPAHSGPTPASSAMFQRPGPSTHGQHQLPATFTQCSAPLDVRFAPLRPFQAPWSPAVDYRSEPLCDEGFPSISAVAQGYTEAGTSRSRPERPHALSGAYDLHGSSRDPFNTAQHGHESQFSPPHSAPAHFQSFAPSYQGSAPVSNILNYPSDATGDFGVQTQGLATQTAVAWPSIPTSSYGSAAPIDYRTDLANAPFSSSMVVMSNNSVLSGFEQRHDMNPAWNLVQARAQDYVNADRVSQLSHISPLANTEQAFGISTPAGRGKRKLPTKKKLPTVPSSFQPRQKKTKTSMRKGPLSPEKREKALQQRQSKQTCVRCRMYHVGCDDGVTCAPCVKAQPNARAYHMGCCRERLEDTSLVRRCNGRFNQEEAVHLRYAFREDRDIVDIEIDWHLPGFGPLNPMQPLNVQCREYIPEGSRINSTESQWQNTSGQLVMFRQAPYAVYDTENFQATVEDYIFSNLHLFNSWIADRTRYDDISRLTFMEAFRVRDQPGNELVDLALQITCLSVISQGYGSVRTDIPGIEKVDFAKMGHSDYEAYDRNSYERPLPPAMNHQMDVALVKILKRLEAKCFKLMEKAVFMSGIKNWYTLFLTLFVLFWNLQYIQSGAKGYIKSKSGTAVESQVSNVVTRQIGKWDFSCDVHMFYWGSCRRTIEPFSVARENPDELLRKGGLPDQDAFYYMRNMATILPQKGSSECKPPDDNTFILFC